MFIQFTAIIQHVRPPEFDHEFTKPILVIAVVFVSILSLFSNSLIIHVVRVNQNKRMRTTTNYFIVNMAFGDSLVAVSISISTIKYLYAGLEWSDGGLGKTLYYMEIVSILSSVLSLVAITFDRFMAVVRPLQYKTCYSWTKYIIPLVWITALALPAHLIFSHLKVTEIGRLNDNKTYIVAIDATTEAAIVASLGYILPHVVMVIMYIIIAYKLWTRRIPGAHVQNHDHQHTAEHQTAKKVTRMIVCVLLVFNVCWFPTFFLICFVHFMHVHNSHHSVAGLLSGSIVAIANGPLNAIIYAIFSQHFREEFKSALGCMRFCRCFC